MMKEISLKTDLACPVMSVSESRLLFVIVLQTFYLFGATLATILDGYRLGICDK